MQGSAPSNAGKNTPVEQPIGTPSDPASQDRPGDPEIDAEPVGQINIDGEVETVTPKEPSIKDIAMQIGRVWVDYRKQINKPVAGGSPVTQVASLVGQFVTAEYSVDEIKRALNGIGEGLPSKGQMQRALDTIRDRKTPGANGRPQQRDRAGARVNGYWDGVRATEGAQPEMAAAGADVQTTGAAW
jgi:hypothetical protein